MNPKISVTILTTTNVDEKCLYTNMENVNGNFPRYNLSWYLEIVLVIAIVYYVNYETPKPESFLLIGIFSSPDNFHQRLSLRKTWLKLAEPGTSVKYYFVLGNSMCPIPPEDRASPYDCRLRPILRGSETFTSLQSYTSSQLPCADGYGFVADYEIAVTHIGVPECLTAQAVNPVRVKLKDGYNGKTLASATFTAGETHMKAITPVRFPRLAEGLVLLEYYNQSAQVRCCSRIEKHHGAITLLSLVRNNRLVPLDDTTGVSPFINYKVLENNTLAAAARRSLSWQGRVEDIYGEVKRENKIFGDIILVNVTDVYRNLPKKLIQFITYLASNEETADYTYVMKTDDDTLVDLRRVEAELRDPWTWTPYPWWWAFFKEYWHVPRTGKWREERYRSATYPPFPCGGGYVLNQATVQHLAAIADNLEFFQGEDVSLGIWLSPVHINTHREAEQTDRAVSYRALMSGQCEETCSWTCDSKPTRRPRCNRVQLSVLEMYETWDQFKKLGFL